MREGSLRQRTLVVSLRLVLDRKFNARATPASERGREELPPSRIPCTCARRLCCIQLGWLD